jgi:hypothetical protein
MAAQGAKKICFCKKDIISLCTAGSVEEQKICRFYRKSSCSDKCMYFMFDKYCDCLEAQTNTEKQGAPEYI